ncbi:MAG: L-threonylcarbamoyladenylate synthase [Candidatus Zixiibacteriota bacterium]
MSTATVITVDIARPNSRAIARAVTALSDGLLVVAPTETRYGLLARADSPDALDRMMAAKQRPVSMPVAVFAPSVHRIPQLAILNRQGKALAEKFLPGPLTLVLENRSKLAPPCVQHKKIGIRVSPSKVISGILEQVTFPVTATSANLSGEGDAETIDDIVIALRDSVAIYLDGGPLTNTVSTVVDCTVDPVLILREGAISRFDIESVAGVAA